MNGYIYRSLYCTTNNLNIYGTINRNAFVNANSISFINEATKKAGKIAGTLNYSSENELVFPDNVVDKGITFTKINADDTKNTVFEYLTTIATILFMSLIIFMLCVWLKPKCITAFKKLNIITFLKAFGVGLISIIILPIISLILLLTVIGIPMCFVIMLTYIVLFMISSYIFSIILAHNLLPNSGILKRLGTTFLISLVIYGLSLIPYLGAIVLGLVYCTGFGFIILPLFNKKDKTNLNNDNTNTIEEKISEDK